MKQDHNSYDLETPNQMTLDAPTDGIQVCQPVVDAFRSLRKAQIQKPLVIYHQSGQFKPISRLMVGEKSNGLLISASSKRNGGCNERYLKQFKSDHPIQSQQKGLLVEQVEESEEQREMEENDELQRTNLNIQDAQQEKHVEANIEIQNPRLNLRRNLIPKPNSKQNSNFIPTVRSGVQKPKKKLITESDEPKNSCVGGLNILTTKICEMIKTQNKELSYGEVVELTIEMHAKELREAKGEKEELPNAVVSNIRRRTYDCLGVLVSSGRLKRSTNKKVSWNPPKPISTMFGPVQSPQQATQHYQEQLKLLQIRMQGKKQLLQSLYNRHYAYQKLIKRNTANLTEEQEQMHSPIFIFDDSMDFKKIVKQDDSTIEIQVSKVARISTSLDLIARYPFMFDKNKCQQEDVEQEEQQ